MGNERLVNVLNGLIQISRDGAEGFRTCAEDTQDTALKMYFQNRARSCEEAIRELNMQVWHYGGNPETIGTRMGTLHRVWVDLKTVVTRHDNLTVLEECERGEAAAIAAYENALWEELPAPLRTLLEKQYKGAKKNHDQVRQMRDTARHAEAT